MQLAAEWGRPASTLLREIPADEWPLWIAFAGVQNLGPEGDDRRAGVIAAKVHNAMTTSQVRLAPSDFFPSLKAAPPRRKAGQRGGTVAPGLRSFLGRHCPALGG